MAYLFAYSATWRALVNATKNPKVMAAFATVTTGGFILMWRGSEKLTEGRMRSTEKELRAKMKNDDEMQRFATTSERALAAMFDQFGKGREENQKHLQHEIKVPGVEWHPKAEERDKRRQQQQQDEKEKQKLTKPTTTATASSAPKTS